MAFSRKVITKYVAGEWKNRRLSNIDEEIFRVKRCRILAEAEIASCMSSK